MKWKIFNVGVIVVSFFSALLCVDISGLGGNKPSLSFCLAIVGFVAAGVMIVCFLQDIVERGRLWLRPSLDNAISFSRQPLQLYMMTAHVLGAMALGALLNGWWMGRISWNWSIYACMAVGAYLGVSLSMRLFKRHMVERRP